MAEHLKQPKTLISILFTVLIILGATVVLSPFLLAILWAGIIATAFWPLHCRIRSKLPGRPNLSAFTTTLVVALLLVGPMIGLFAFMVTDILELLTFLRTADQKGIPTPKWLVQVPVFGDLLAVTWKKYLSIPRQISGLLRDTLSQPLGLVQRTASVLVLDFFGRVATLFFALWVLFFFYRDGSALTVRMNRIGTEWLGPRWKPYVSHMPPALRAAVNGLVIVSFAEAVVLSVLFYYCGVFAPVILGTATALIAFIPMAAPALLGILGMVLILSGHGAEAIVLMSAGMLIVMVADYLVRPLLIQGGTHLPFLAVLFGVFGGVITMGIVGLIIGPVLLVLLVVFFDEASHPPQEESPALP
ncbi:AI-2E family transporter [Limnobacter humi]|uniref:AI-2E family transporter n=1 Tax=Limnobacter humi TaxID=1778671 RepID=A0ABT1WEL9_9BURK|nr:AI-2E family transporter [Limnobacter humi]MCQ8895965.1 AI-2E family transporter [Limnobacter humi]